MTKYMLVFAAVVIAALAARPVLAEEERGFIGFTDAKTNGRAGLLEMHAMCAAEFKDAHFCSTSDIIREGGRVPQFGFLAAIGWINPTLVGVTSIGEELLYVDATGFSDTFKRGGLSCNSWQSFDVGKTGLVLSTFSDIFDPILPDAFDCNEELAVSCCGPRQPIQRSAVPTGPIR